MKLKSNGAFRKKNINKSNIGLLKCTTDYPSDPIDSNLKTITTMGIYLMFKSDSPITH